MLRLPSKTLPTLTAISLAGLAAFSQVETGDAGVTVSTPAAAAQTAKKKPKGAGPRCVLSGKTQVEKNLVIYDKSKDGKPIAKFSGAASTLKVSDFPRSKDGMVWVETGTGTGNLRIEGWVDGDQIPIYTKTMIAVIPGHVWIGEHREVRFDGSRPNKLKVKKHLKTPVAQTFRGWANCSNLTLNQGVPPGAEIDGEARGYRMRKDSVVLYDDYGREKSELLTLYKSSAGREVVFWSTKRQGGYVQVSYQGEILIEAWAKWNQLKSVPKGELVDQLQPSTRTKATASLKLAGNPKVVKAPKEIKVRSTAKADGLVVGRIEKDAEVYVVDVVAGYASVMAKALNVLPPKDGQFWVDNSELQPKKKADEKAEGSGS